MSETKLATERDVVLSWLLTSVLIVLAFVSLLLTIGHTVKRIESMQPCRQEAKP